MFACLSMQAQQSLYNSTQPVCGLSIGAHAAFGTHVQRLGFTLHFHVIQNHIQANCELKLFYHFKNLGPKQMHPEMVLTQGLVYAWGNNPETVSVFENAVSNQTVYKYAVAYAYNAYFNNIGTTQQTGILGIYINRWQLLTENDLLAKPSLDRFRTAAMMVQYRYQNDYLFGMHCTLWTGQFGHKQQIDDPHFKNHCYMDTVGGKHYRHSHGILAFQLNTHQFADQNLQVNAGVDAEQIRQAVQNKFIHDMPFVPSRWIKNKNCHLPMLDEHMQPYLFMSDQKIRKAKPYFNLSNNAPLFY